MTLNKKTSVSLSSNEIFKLLIKSLSNNDNRDKLSRIYNSIVNDHCEPAICMSDDFNRVTVELYDKSTNTKDYEELNDKETAIVHLIISINNTFERVDTGTAHIVISENVCNCDKE